MGCGGRWGMGMGRGGPWGPCHRGRGFGSAGCPRRPWGAGGGSGQPGATPAGSDQQNVSQQNPDKTPAPTTSPATNPETGPIASDHNISGSPEGGWTIVNDSESAPDVEGATTGVRDLEMTDKTDGNDLMSFAVPSE